MEKTLKMIGVAKWICFPLGYTMYFFTRGSFGETAAGILGIIATVAFWALVRNEQTRLIGQSIAFEIKSAINSVGNFENFIEIKKIKKGIIARVYLINSGSGAAVIQRAITEKIEESALKKYLWIMQLTDMESKKDLKKTQKILNEQLLEELLKQKEDK